VKEVVQRNAPKGPGPKGSPKRAIINRWSQGSFRYANLECGHKVRLTKGYPWDLGALIPCPECPRKRK
jgi:hypothetical protein